MNYGCAMRRLEYEAENKLYLAETERIKISKEHERKIEEIKKYKIK
jgi:hypothetical protein